MPNVPLLILYIFGYLCKWKHFGVFQLNILNTSSLSDSQMQFSNCWYQGINIFENAVGVINNAIFCRIISTPVKEYNSDEDMGMEKK